MKIKRNRNLASGLLFLLLVLFSMACQQTVVLSDADEKNDSGKSEIEIIKNRFTGELLEPEVNEDKILNLMGTVGKDGTWSDINYKDTTLTGFEHGRHLNNLIRLARAYQKKESDFYHDPQLKQVIHSGLDFWLEHDFISENWWWNQIGTPGRMGNLLLIMDEEVTQEQKALAGPIVGRANLDAWGARPGGDLIQIAGIMGKYGVFINDPETINEALEAITGEIKFAADRGDASDVRGLQTDFSFHHRHDRVTSTITYGESFAASFVDWADKVRQTEYRFSDEAIELIVDFYLDGISKTLAYGKYPDPGAKNRGVARRNALKPQSPEILEKLLRITTYRQDELEAIAQIRKGNHIPDLSSSRFFWHSEYYSHQRPHFFTSVRMYSSRNHSVEMPYNAEGLKNHHLGDGYNFITRTGEEYVDIFPVWDWQKIPGTTVVQKPSLPGPNQVQQRGLTDFVGGITDGEYGAAVFDFESPIDSLLARKSWFFFDNEFISMGTAIDSESQYPVATTLNQSLLKGDVVSGGSGGESLYSTGIYSLEEIDWIHHDETAYIFPEPAAVRLENRERSGYWRRINGQSWAKGLDEVHKDVFTLWLDHGVEPEQADYEYIVVPGIKASDIEQYRENSPIEILTNTPEIQAVRHTGLNISQIVFYEAGKIEIMEGIIISANAPGLVMFKISGDQLQEITVSDPSRQLDSYRLKVTSRLEIDDEQWEAEWDENEGYSIIYIDLPDGEYAGQSVSGEFIN